MEITIKEKQYKVKYTLRALFIYEQITGKIFKLESITDEYVFFYCLLAANNPEIELSFNDFIDAMDENVNLIIQFSDFMKAELEKQNMFITNKTSDIKKKPLQ